MRKQIEEQTGKQTKNQTEETKMSVNEPKDMRDLLGLSGKTEEQRNEILLLPAKTEVRPSGSLAGEKTATQANPPPTCSIQ